MKMVNKVIILFILSVLLLGMQLGKDMHKTDMKNDTERDIFNFTENKINVNSTSDGMDTISINESNFKKARVESIFNSLIMFIEDSGNQIARLGIELGYVNYNDQYMFLKTKILLYGLLFIVLWKPVLYMSFILYELTRWVIDKVRL